MAPKFHNKIVWIIERSESGIDKLPENMDYIYIDGDHRYEKVKIDIEKQLSYR